jgi:hypothetical protein
MEHFKTPTHHNKMKPDTLSPLVLLVALNAINLIMLPLL